MLRTCLIALTVLALFAGTVQAQPLSATEPTDPAQKGPWREAWYAYGRDIRAYCGTHFLDHIQACLNREMATQGVSPAFFADLYRTAPKPALPPVPRGTTTTCRWTSSGGMDAYESTMICTTD